MFTKPASDAALQEVADWNVFRQGLVALHEAGIAGRINNVADILRHLPAGCCTAIFEPDSNRAVVTIGVFTLGRVADQHTRLLLTDQLYEGGFLPRAVAQPRATPMGQDSTWKKVLAGPMFNFEWARPGFPWTFPVQSTARYIHISMAPTTPGQAPYNPFTDVRSRVEHVDFQMVESATIRVDALREATWSAWLPTPSSGR